MKIQMTVAHSLKNGYHITGNRFHQQFLVSLVFCGK